MKRRLKSLFRIAISFITLGSVMVIAGLLLGGAGELSKEVTELVHVMRVGVSETVERIPLLERITNFNGFTVVVDLDEEDVSVDFNKDFETITGDYSNLKLADSTEVENLNISILNGKCTVLPSANGYFGVQSKGAKEYQCYVSEGTLYLSALPTDFGETGTAEIVLYVPKEQEYSNVFLFCSAEQVTVEVPLKGEELKASSICGTNTFGEELVFDRVVATVGIGKFKAGRLVAEDFKLEVGTAEATIDDLEAGTLDVNLGMGSITLQGITTGDITLSCGMGHLEMVLGCRQEAYNYDISGSAESVQIGKDTLAGMVMERWIDNGSDKKINMSCAMGSVKIEFVQ